MPGGSSVCLTTLQVAPVSNWNRIWRTPTCMVANRCFLYDWCVRVWIASVGVLSDFGIRVIVKSCSSDSVSSLVLSTSCKLRIRCLDRRFLLPYYCYSMPPAIPHKFLDRCDEVWNTSLCRCLRKVRKSLRILNRVITLACLFFGGISWHSG